MDVFKFRPILKQTLWGGGKIVPFKGLNDGLQDVGESWEVSGVRGSESVVAEGRFAGRTLNDVLGELGARLVGRDNYERFGNEFPLLVKFIDAREQLSIQVHPNDAQAAAKGLGRGKTEMWFVMKSDVDAKLRSGLRREISPEEYERMVEDGTITEALAEYDVREGDVFFLPAGRIHSIGAGCFLAEIQETSDVTYRIFDFGRRDKMGRCRELHTREAAECIDYRVERNYRTEYEPRRDEPVELVSCEHFVTSLYDLTEPMTMDYSELDSFVILIGLEGSGVLTDDGGREHLLRGGESLLLSADAGEVSVSGGVKFLETYV